jgi:type III secretion protein V
MDGLILALNRWAGMAAQRAEIVAAAFVVAIVFMLVLPMPIWLLDGLIAVNLCISGLIVVVSMYMAGPTAFSTFPAVLLLTTLFRLAISVSTTRLILLEGDAGHIVETFGNFVVGGNIVVGLVVFLILTVVQFIVITKGSERVSEVTARFTLDAMPGKQMSIDSDLRAGLITADVARAKRAELGRESQLHGAMDGAMKFVKGDAIAGIFIVLVNLVGGITIGVLMNGMDMATAGRTYSVLTIGDALIAQIPALLISLTAGLITTRVSSDEDHTKGDDGEEAKQSNVGREIVQELTKQPKALLTAGGIMFVFAIVPGMPWPVFVALGLALLTGGFVAIRAPKVQAQAAANAEAAATAMRDAAPPRFVDAVTFRATRPMQLVLSNDLQNTADAERIQLAVRVMRNRVISQRGIPDFPALEVLYDAALLEKTVQFRVVEVPLVTARHRLGWGATTEPKERLESLGFDGTELAVVEGTRRHRCWVDLRHEAALRDAGVDWEPWETVFAHDVEAEMVRNCSMFLGIQEAARFQEYANRNLPELGKELARAVPLARLAEVLQRLARDGVSLRNVRLVLETALEWAQKERDSDLVCDHVRLALRRQLCHEVARDGLIRALLLTPELEQRMRESVRRSSAGEYLELDSDVEQSVLDQLGALCGTGGTGVQQPVLVTTADIRRQVRRLVEEEFFSLPVFAYTELSQHYRVQPVGVLNG